MTSKLNKPERYTCFRSHTKSGELSCTTCQHNKIIDSMDAYYKEYIKQIKEEQDLFYSSILKRKDADHKQFIKDNILSEEEIFKDIGHGWVEKDYNARYIAKSIHKLIKERLQI